MSPTADGADKVAIRLLPHQRAFVDTVFDPRGARIIRLQANVGSGKGTALVAVTERLFHQEPAARVLFIVPAPLRTEFEYRFRQLRIPAFALDRYAFRELLDREQSRDFWPAGGVVIVSAEFARQEDVLDKLIQSQWDLVVVDDAHTMRGQRAELIRRIAQRSEKTILASTLQLHETGPLQDTDATVVEWRPEQIVDFLPASIALHELAYRLSDAEQHLRAAVLEISRALGSEKGNLSGTILLQAFESSPAALDRALRQVRQRVAEADVLEDIASSDVPEEENILAAESSISQELETLVERVLAVLDATDNDSKLSVFMKFVARLQVGPRRSVLVLTNFVATAYYLAAELEQNGIVPMLLHGSMSYDERFTSVHTFLDRGGILVATSAAVATGFDLSTVTDLVLYDTQRRKDLLHNIIGRINRIGKRPDLDVYVMRCADEPSSEDATALLLDVLSSSGTIVKSQ